MACSVISRDWVRGVRESLQGSLAWQVLCSRHERQVYTALFDYVSRVRCTSGIRNHELLNCELIYHTRCLGNQPECNFTNSMLDIRARGLVLHSSVAANWCDCHRVWCLLRTCDSKLLLRTRRNTSKVTNKEASFSYSLDLAFVSAGYRSLRVDGLTVYIELASALLPTDHTSVSRVFRPVRIQRGVLY